MPLLMNNKYIALNKFITSTLIIKVGKSIVQRIKSSRHFVKLCALFSYLIPKKKNMAFELFRMGQKEVRSSLDLQYP